MCKKNWNCFDDDYKRIKTILKVQVITLPTWKWVLNRKRDFNCQGCLVKNVTMLSNFPSGKEHQYTNACVGSISTKQWCLCVTKRIKWRKCPNEVGHVKCVWGW
jgi:hypothetical protein